MNHKTLLSLLVTLGLGSATGPRADDTELFVQDFAQTGNVRPKVMIIFDTSGSMRETVTVEKAPYDASVTYARLDDGDSAALDNQLFLGLSGQNADTPPMTSNFRFDTGKNACASSVSALNQTGFFQSVFGYLTTNSQQARWNGFSRNSVMSDIRLVDCVADINASNTGNNGITTPACVSTGYPAINPTLSQCYTSDRNQALTPPADAPNLVLYTANYLRWYHGSPQTSEQSRLAVAQRAVSDLIRSSSGVDFGLMVFNRNHGDGSNDENGGRIIRDIALNDASGKADILGKIDSLDADSWTPLCETLYEAYRYFGGSTVYYGDDDPTLTPLRDTSAETAGRYNAPFDTCADDAYVIYITDGAPTRDAHANGRVETLINGLSATARADYGGVVGYNNGNNTSWLAALAGYMKHNDINADIAGRQTVTTFTIGFGNDAIADAETLLQETARRGGGSYYPATDASALLYALKSSLLSILQINTTLVSPAITSNNLDRTRSLDNIYYAMFEPGPGPRWVGNLKKLKIGANGVVDQDNLPAIGADGLMHRYSHSHWSLEVDGNEVKKGGVLEMLAGGSSTRDLKVISGSSLGALTLDQLEGIAGSATALKAHLGVSSDGERNTLLNWTKGVDVDDEDGDSATNDRRPYILGDPLHSRPIVINYGAAQQGGTPDLRIILGTNAGFLHMFKDLGNTVLESWAVIPYPLLANQKALRTNAESNQHIYGVDASPVALVQDANKDGVINATDGDKVWLYFGLRRGGRSYYALDISSPDSPAFMWHIDPTRTGFARLGQSWSVPQLGHVDGVDDPVLIFGGGYDANKDAGGIGTADTMGNAIYIVNARTGALIFSAGPDTGSATHVQHTGMSHGIPGEVTVLDTDDNGKLDRIYAADTGGNVWRMDMAGSDTSTWSVFKLAELGTEKMIANNLLDDPATDRRFFYSPIVVRTINQITTRQIVDGQVVYGYREKPFDAVLIGSGDRSKPASDTTVNNGYFMLRDHQILPGSFRNNPPTTITRSDLYNITSDPLSNAQSETEELDIKAALTGANGWVNWLTETGEKSFGAGLVLEGRLYFTSFIPQGLPSDQCVISSIGTTRQYMMDMHYGTAFDYASDADGNNTTLRRYVEVSNKVAENLVIHAGESGKVYILGGAPGKEVIRRNEDDDDDDEEDPRCTRAGECTEGGDEAELNLSPAHIFIYEEEAP